MRRKQRKQQCRKVSQRLYNYVSTGAAFCPSAGYPLYPIWRPLPSPYLASPACHLLASLALTLFACQTCLYPFLGNMYFYHLTFHSYNEQAIVQSFSCPSLTLWNPFSTHKRSLNFVVNLVVAFPRNGGARPRNTFSIPRRNFAPRILRSLLGASATPSASSLRPRVSVVSMEYYYQKASILARATNLRPGSPYIGRIWLVPC